MNIDSIVKYAHVLAQDPLLFTEDSYLDIRLNIQLSDDEQTTIKLLYGDPQYDTDHRGEWGYGHLTYGQSKKDVKEMILQMYDEILDNLFEDHLPEWLKELYYDYLNCK